jgi:hypothetical protein
MAGQHKYITPLRLISLFRPGQPLCHLPGLTFSPYHSAWWDEWSAEQLDFLKMIQELKREVGPWPTWVQVLRKAKACGWRKVAAAGGS